MEKFDTFYYTEAFISDKRTLSLLSLLSDSVYIFYLSPDYFLKPLQERWETEKEQPFFKKAPIKSDLISPIYKSKYLEFVERNRELIEAKVICPILVKKTPPDWRSFEEYEKKMMRDYSGLSIGMWGIKMGLVPDPVAENKVYVDAPHYSLYRWQSFCGALHFAINAKITPISDNPLLSSVACETVTRFSDLNIQSSAEDLSKLLGFKVLSIMLPKFGDLQPKQILEIRDELREELMAFKYEMRQVTTESKIDESNLDDYITLKIKPRLDDIKLKMSCSKNELYRNIGMNILATGTGTTLLTQFINFPTHAQIAVGIGLVGKILFDYLGYRNTKKELLSKSESKGFAFLLDLENRYSK